MAASANRDGNQEGVKASLFFIEGGEGGSHPGISKSNNVVAGASGFSSSMQGLKHNPGLSLKFSREEVVILKEGLVKYASDSIIMRYAKIAMQLPGKTVRDVALRCRWMSKKESGKRRKEDHNLTRKSKDKKERVTDPSAKPSVHMPPRHGVPPYNLPVLPVDNDDEISYKAIGGPTAQLLEHNAQFFSQIHANLATYQLQENVNLFCQTRDNIMSILNEMNDMPGVMKQMPPLPVKMNEELANSILPRSSMPLQT